MNTMPQLCSSSRAHTCSQLWRCRQGSHEVGVRQRGAASISTAAAGAPAGIPLCCRLLLAAVFTCPGAAAAATAPANRGKLPCAAPDAVRGWHPERGHAARLGHGLEPGAAGGAAVRRQPNAGATVRLQTEVKLLCKAGWRPLPCNQVAQQDSD